jgi:hypothetical protein
MSAYRDGSAVMSLDEGANLMCNFTDITLNVSEDTGFDVINNNLTYIDQYYTIYDNILTPYLESHSDILLCGTYSLVPVGISEISEQKERVSIVSEIGATYFENLSGESIHLEIYNLQGQLVSKGSIDVYCGKESHLPRQESSRLLPFRILGHNGVNITNCRAFQERYPPTCGLA